MVGTLTHARELIISTMQADADVVSYVPSARHYPGKTPTGPVKPFIQVRGLEGLPVRGSCLSGDEVSATVHVFADVSNGVLDPETFCSDACTAIARALDGAPKIIAERVLVVVDNDEADEYHGMVFVRVEAVEQA